MAALFVTDFEGCDSGAAGIPTASVGALGDEAGGLRCPPRSHAGSSGGIAASLLHFPEAECWVAYEVQVTVVHEIAHHFGIDYERLDELGWG